MVFYRLHHFAPREWIIRRAWDSGTEDFDGAPIKLMPDLSRATLYRRALLHSLLDLARRAGATYRWGYPLYVTFHKPNSSFTLRSQLDLPALFAFLDVDPIQVPNWLLLLPRPSYRRATASRGASASPRPQRVQRGSR